MSAEALFREILDARWEGVEAWKTDSASELSDLEFKTSDWQGSKLNPADKKNLGRTTSAFANTEGGVIVFGVKTKKTDEGADRVVQIQEIEKLQLFVDKINEHVRLCTDPTVPGVKAEAIYKPGADDVGVAAVLVPESDVGPHRARHSTAEWDDRYFIRAGTSTGIMAHTTLAAMFGRRPAPRLSVEITHLPGTGGSERWTLAVRNSGRGVARSVLLRYSLKHTESHDQADLTKSLTSGSGAPTSWHGWQRTREPLSQDPRWWFWRSPGFVDIPCSLRRAPGVIPWQDASDVRSPHNSRPMLFVS